MKANYLERKAGSDSLKLGEMPRPAPEPGQLLVKVCATAVMPTEFQWYPTFNRRSGEARPFPIVLSHEFSGVVESLGPNVRDFQIGDAVYGLNDWFNNGAQAEFCVAAAKSVALKPKSLDHVQSAVVPISALTAWQGLFKRTSLQEGESVLIHGAAGGVGAFAVQLAYWRGAKVFATASTADLDFVRSLGAHQVTDYTTSRFEDVISDMDVVFDTVGGETLQRSWDVLKSGGRLVTVATQGKDMETRPFEMEAEQRNRESFMLVEADGSQLAEIGKLIDAGELRVFVEAVFPLSHAREAYSRAQRGKMRGKIALQIAGHDVAPISNPKDPLITSPVV